MGLLWYGSIILYSISTVKLGDLGTSIGWPLFLAAIVVASTVFGVADRRMGAHRHAPDPNDDCWE